MSPITLNPIVVNKSYNIECSGNKKHLIVANMMLSQYLLLREVCCE